MIWVGVDPGPRSTGICARQGQHLIGYAVIDTQDHEPDSGRPGRPTLDVIEATIHRLGGDAFRVAVEDTTAPNAHHQGQVHIIDVEPLLRAAEVVGWVERAFPTAVRVRPASHGSHALASYPADIVSPQERANAVRRRRLLAPAPQNGQLKHARSAWDIAGAGAKETRITAARIAAQARRRTP